MASHHLLLNNSMFKLCTTYAPNSAGWKPPSYSAIRHSSTDVRRCLRSRRAAAAQIETLQEKGAFFFTSLCDAVDDWIDTVFMRHPFPSFVDPERVLAENYGPVKELPPTECPVVDGKLPPCLSGGAYIRNGPNCQFPSKKGVYHPFEGDGMLHSLLITADGRAIFCSRLIRTYKLVMEARAGKPLYPGHFSDFYSFAGVAKSLLMLVRFLTGQLDPLKGMGTANTSVVFFNNKLMALCEYDLPYIVQLMPNGDISTGRRLNFEGELSVGMTAHPKIDPETGEMFAFRCWPFFPFCYLRIGADGRLRKKFPIWSFGFPLFAHDFAITRKYTIFCDVQVTMRKMDVLTGKGPMMSYDPSKVPRIGIIHRSATDESSIRWFAVPGLNVMHAINAWDEEGGGEIVLICTNCRPLEHFLENLDLTKFGVEMVRISLTEGKVLSRRILSEKNLEMGTINTQYLGRKNRYVYLGQGDSTLLPKASAVVKLDLQKLDDGDCVVAQRSFGDQCFGGEPFFVARNEDNGGEEDDGYVVTYVHDEQSGVSRFVVMDAKSSTLDIVASVKLPQRVPYGFHGLFVGNMNLKMQSQPDNF